MVWYGSANEWHWYGTIPYSVRIPFHSTPLHTIPYNTQNLLLITLQALVMLLLVVSQQGFLLVGTHGRKGRRYLCKSWRSRSRSMKERGDAMAGREYGMVQYNTRAATRQDADEWLEAQVRVQLDESFRGSGFVMGRAGRCEPCGTNRSV